MNPDTKNWTELGNQVGKRVEISTEMRIKRGGGEGRGVEN
jgi:hypothetical protein